MRKSILKIIIIVEICILIFLGAYIINDRYKEETDSLKITITLDTINTISDITDVPKINKYEPKTIIELGFPFKYINNLTNYPVEMPYAIFPAKPD